jgi:hypothetical protein
MNAIKCSKRTTCISLASIYRPTQTGALWGLVLLIGGCAMQPSAPESVGRAVSPDAPASCDEVLSYRVADAHPSIRWISPRSGVSSDAALGCLLRSEADDGTIELAAYMSSGLYRFVRECSTEEASIYRLFEYKNKGRPYFLRLHTNQFVDPQTYVVVSSHRRPAGHYHHGIAGRSNEASKIRFCAPVHHM